MSVARERLQSFPGLAVTGPRQFGNTTLSRLLFPEAGYFSLEDPDVRAYATEDPRLFIGRPGRIALLTLQPFSLDELHSVVASSHGRRRLAISNRVYVFTRRQDPGLHLNIV